MCHGWRLVVTVCMNRTRSDCVMPKKIEKATSIIHSSRYQAWNECKYKKNKAIQRVTLHGSFQVELGSTCNHNRRCKRKRHFYGNERCFKLYKSRLFHFVQFVTGRRKIFSKWKRKSSSCAHHSPPKAPPPA